MGRGPARGRARLHPVAVPAAGAERVQPAGADPHRGDDRGLPRRPAAAAAAAAIAGADARISTGWRWSRTGTARRASSRRATSPRRAAGWLHARRPQPPAPHAHPDQRCGCSVSTITAGRCIACLADDRARSPARGVGDDAGLLARAAAPSAPSSFRASAAAGSPVRATRPGACRPAAARRTRRGTAAAAP